MKEIRLDKSRATRAVVNDRMYRTPDRPVIVVCFDGCDPAYIAAASTKGVIPNLNHMRSKGFSTTALAAMPTFTNPNNVSIVCGVPPSIHGVSGNYYFDRSTGRDVMMLDEGPLRAPTILASMSAIGVRVAAVTAKDKLRKALSAGLVNGISLSAERPQQAELHEYGIDDILKLAGRSAQPHQYSADLSLFVLDVGEVLLNGGISDLLYLSLSDYVQHKHGPEDPEALEFMAAVDRRIGSFLSKGAIVGVVADHGMTDMAKDDGSPNVLYLGDHLSSVFGEEAARVICPITDPFVRHHGALGGFVRVHLDQNAPPSLGQSMLANIHSLPEVELALAREEACSQFSLPYEPEGDIVVFARKGIALGNRADEHDLSQLAGARLRSHGGLSERNVPFILSHPLSDEYRERAQAMPVNNFDIFDFALNGVESTEVA